VKRLALFKEAVEILRQGESHVVPSPGDIPGHDGLSAAELPCPWFRADCETL